jgi:hypothetical protein
MMVFRTASKAFSIRMACLVMLAHVSAPGRTFEGFTVAAKAGLSLNNPLILDYYHPGTVLFAISPGIKLFENRLTLEGDVGISDRLMEHQGRDWMSTSWHARQDTLFRTARVTHEAADMYRFFYAYKGVLNVGSWSFFAGHMVFVRIMDVTESGTRFIEYTTSAVDSIRPQSSEPIANRYQWGNGIVVPVYGIARRFGRWSLHLQGASILSLQALVAVSLSPIRGIGPHR